MSVNTRTEDKKKEEAYHPLQVVSFSKDVYLLLARAPWGSETLGTPSVEFKVVSLPPEQNETKKDDAPRQANFASATLRRSRQCVEEPSIPGVSISRTYSLFGRFISKVEEFDPRDQQPRRGRYGEHTPTAEILRHGVVTDQSVMDAVCLMIQQEINDGKYRHFDEHFGVATSVTAVEGWEHLMPKRLQVLSCEEYFNSQLLSKLHLSQHGQGEVKIELSYKTTTLSWASTATLFGRLRNSTLVKAQEDAALAELLVQMYGTSFVAMPRW